MSVCIDDGQFTLLRFSEDGIGFFEGYALWSGDEVFKGSHDCGYFIGGVRMELDVSKGDDAEKFSIKFAGIYR
jgi:hypothetical protein